MSVHVVQSVDQRENRKVARICRNNPVGWPHRTDHLGKPSGRSEEIESFLKLGFFHLGVDFDFANRS
jgi:hypothetical protein